MNEEELRAFLLESGKQPPDFIEETVALTSAARARLYAALQGRDLTDEEAEESARILRADFVESIRIIKEGGALGFDAWRPEV